ncbi:hypothetical protein AB0B30_21240 [Streptomyces narbonensis]|uniref:Uncharacterized protein n=1 Tax=Streptomyces narbonensis TaxID=67333 RepID=A0ABV3CA85_9ACTN
MATPQRAEAGVEAAHGRNHVPMGELLASCAAARALSTPPRRPGPGAEEQEQGQRQRQDEAVLRRGAAA